MSADGQYTRGISASPVTAQELGDFSGILFYSVIIFFYSLAFYCIIKLWMKRETILKKLYWTFVLLIPILGVLLYGAFYDSKNEKAETGHRPTKKPNSTGQ